MAEDCDADLRERLTRLETTLMGVDGTNGKLGTLRADLDKVRALAETGKRWLTRAAAALAGVATAIVIPVVVMVRDGASSAARDREALTARVIRLEAEVSLLRLLKGLTP